MNTKLLKLLTKTNAGVFVGWVRYSLASPKSVLQCECLTALEIFSEILIRPTVTIDFCKTNSAVLLVIFFINTGFDLNTDLGLTKSVSPGTLQSAPLQSTYLSPRPMLPPSALTWYPMGGIQF